MSEARALTNDMCETALGVTAEPALVKGRVLCWVGNSAILAVPSEVQDVANFPAALGNAPFAQVPDARCESGGGTQPLAVPVRLRASSSSRPAEISNGSMVIGTPPSSAARRGT